ncbi:Hexosyltransferase [Rhynchospora pubera]|uniref:Hexosyltransferase n=1 Tax=Rhynchospora pubera TaxID=906938 RepID=A0AAV8FHD9_9POAL|nr:Hexosyltransferase [Rhynchospora pubera]
MSDKTISYTPIILILLPLVLLSAIFFIPNSNSYLQLNFFSNSCQPAALPPQHLPKSKPEFKLLIGIITVPEKTERRHIIRMAYELQKPIPHAQIDIRFVFCQLKTEEQKVFIAMEILRYRDIIILNCTENMNEGKTYTYFSSVPKMFQGEEQPYDYVMKADDDAYFRLDNLFDALRDKPRVDTYWGKGYPPLDQDNPPYLVGMGYALSWDLVQWIAESDFARNNTHGIEDINLAMWLNVAGKGKNRFNMREKMYDFHGVEVKDFPNYTIAVHVLKNDFTWMVTLKNFNVTGGLEPSPFYHL